VKGVLIVAVVAVALIVAIVYLKRGRRL